MKKHAPRNTTALFLGFAAVSVAALVWTAVRLARQDRLLEIRQLEQRHEAAADRIVASLEQALQAEERRLAGLPDVDQVPAAGEAVLLLAGPSDVRVWPENGLLFFPAAVPGREAEARLYAEADRYEFVDRDHRRAIAVLRPLTRADDPAVSAGAGIRLARNFRKLGDIEGALAAYAVVAASTAPGVSFSGAPADLVARHARCVLLEEAGRLDNLRAEASSLGDDLKGGRWRLDRDSYLYFHGETARRLGREPSDDGEGLALAEAVVWLCQNCRALADFERGSSGRSVFRRHGVSVAVLWRISNENLAALAAGPAYQRNRWLNPVLGSPDLGGVSVGLRDADGALVCGREPEAGRSATLRPGTASGLPWDIVVGNADHEAVVSQFAQRRRLMTAGLGMLALLVVAAGYFIGRAVSRELAAARLQSDFVSAVSHEFRTPLTSMRQFTEMLVEDERLPAEKRRAFYQAQERATRRLSRLVESLLDFGRMEAGARPYRLERLDAGRLITKTVEEFRQESGVQGLTLECAVPAEGPLVEADREALAQALWNLLDNAVKYSGDGPSVRVEVEAGDQVAIRVRDKGIGIPPSERKRIFRKFVRGSSAGTVGVKGMGIGLAMVKHIVDAHGGKILVDGAPGEGSTFTIVLPTGG
jgi:signal transduction histidine kinase